MNETDTSHNPLTGWEWTRSSHDHRTAFARAIHGLKYIHLEVWARLEISRVPAWIEHGFPEVHRIFTRMYFESVSNLCVMGGDAATLLPRSAKLASMTWTSKNDAPEKHFHQHRKEICHSYKFRTCALMWWSCIRNASRKPFEAFRPWICVAYLCEFSRAASCERQRGGAFYSLCIYVCIHTCCMCIYKYVIYIYNTFIWYY